MLYLFRIKVKNATKSCSNIAFLELLFDIEQK